jgi:hypothetical protein
MPPAESAGTSLFLYGMFAVSLTGFREVFDKKGITAWSSRRTWSYPKVIRSLISGGNEDKDGNYNFFTAWRNLWLFWPYQKKILFWNGVEHILVNHVAAGVV